MCSFFSSSPILCAACSSQTVMLWSHSCLPWTLLNIPEAWKSQKYLDAIAIWIITIRILFFEKIQAALLHRFMKPFTGRKHIFLKGVWSLALPSADITSLCKNVCILNFYKNKFVFFKNNEFVLVIFGGVSDWNNSITRCRKSCGSHHSKF